MLLLIVGIPSFAQKGQIELSLYGGLLSIAKQKIPTMERLVLALNWAFSLSTS